MKYLSGMVEKPNWRVFYAYSSPKNKFATHNSTNPCGGGCCSIKKTPGWGVLLSLIIV